MKIIQTNFKYRKPLVPLNLDKVEHIVIHHTASKTATPEQIHQWHLERDNGTWAGFGYNAYIRKDGTVYIGRGDHIGAQVANKNSTTYGICLEGNYDIETEVPKVQLEALAEYIKSIQPKFKNLKGIKKHSDLQAKACPGKHFPFDKLLDMVKEDEVQKAIYNLSMKGIINSPQYWFDNAKPGQMVKGENAAALILKVSKYLG